MPVVLPSGIQGLAFLKKASMLARHHSPQYWRLKSGFIACNEYYALYEEHIRFTRLNVKTMSDARTKVAKRDRSK